MRSDETPDRQSCPPSLVLAAWGGILLATTQIHDPRESFVNLRGRQQDAFWLCGGAVGWIVSGRRGTWVPVEEVGPGFDGEGAGAWAGRLAGR